MYFVFLGEWNPPLLLIHTRGEGFHSSKWIARANAYSSHHCVVNSEVCSLFYRVSLGFSKSFFGDPMQNLNGMTDFRGEKF